jgi:large subunit ribosomal protein L35
MPKQKTSRAAKKRFKLTGSGKILRRRAMKSHLLEKKSPKRKRSFRRPAALSGSDYREVVRMLGGKKGGH